MFSANISKELGDGMRVSKDTELLRPTLLDIDYILQYEPWVDKILLLHREDVYNVMNDKKSLVEIIIAKNSMGAANKIMLSFYPEFGRFENNIYAEEKIK